MTPEEFKQIRKSLKLTQLNISKLIFKSLRTVQYYECGQRKIPMLVEASMREKLDFKGKINYD